MDVNLVAFWVLDGLTGGAVCDVVAIGQSEESVSVLIGEREMF